MKKKKSMQRENQNSSTISHRPKKTVNVNVVVHGDNQSNESSLSQKQDNRVYQEPIPTLSPSDDLRQGSLGKPDEGLKEQLSRSIQNLDIANDLASQKNIVLPTTLQNIPKSILDVKSSNDIRNLIKHIDNMVLEINKLTTVPTAIQ
jgi:LPS O-antigen subunit length determinant protein (WzzB/FepE family)